MKSIFIYKFNSVLFMYVQFLSPKSRFNFAVLLCEPSIHLLALSIVQGSLLESGAIFF